MDTGSLYLQQIIHCKLGTVKRQQCHLNLMFFFGGSWKIGGTRCYLTLFKCYDAYQGIKLLPALHPKITTN